MSNIDLPVPFLQGCALNKDCVRLSSDTPAPSPPIPLHSDQKADHQVVDYLPGYPAVPLVPTEICAHLSYELDTPLLDELYDKLWLVGTPSGLYIDALQTHRVKGRTIVPTDDPRLHLIWDHDKVYVKPIPIFLTNYDVWAIYLSSESAAVAFQRSTAMGFLRSYSLLISHPLDLDIAKEAYLVPKEIDWIQWCKFISYFRPVGDENVARRYHYGQLRLTRLNWLVRVFRPKRGHNKWFYELPHWSISEFAAAYTIPLIFIFATVSLILSSMQVALSVPAEVLWFDEHSIGLQGIGRVFWIFSIAVVLLWTLFWLLLFMIPLVVLGCQLTWGFKHRIKFNDKAKGTV